MKAARGIGIAVDHRRRNRCTESLQANAERLKAYKENLIIFPKKNSKPKAGEASKEDMEGIEQVRGPIMPIKKAAPKVEYASITPDMQVQRDSPFSAETKACLLPIVVTCAGSNALGGNNRFSTSKSGFVKWLCRMPFGLPAHGTTVRRARCSIACRTRPCTRSCVWSA